MVYIVKKIINGKKYYYLKQSKRIGNKIISKNIAYFGKKRPTKKEIKTKLEQISAIKQQKQRGVGDFNKKEQAQPDNIPPIEYKENKVPLLNNDKLFKSNKDSNIMLTINDIAVFCKKKGFVYQNSEIYGGFSGFFDYGPLGVELKNNIKRAFWERFVHQRDDVVGIDGTIITHPTVWKASGHIDSFTDYIYKCDKCKQLLKGETDKGMNCPKCNAELKSMGKFNLMFSTQVGPIPSNESTAYLRPETAQVIFADYKLVQECARKKLPFGIAQVGKAFRNEISPRDFLFRSREFEQFEIEFFVHPNKVNECEHIKEIENMKVQILTAENQDKNQEHGIMTINHLLDILKEQFGFDDELDYAFLLSEKNKIYIVNREIEKIDLTKLRVNSYGLYIGELVDDKIRLTIEGSQIIGKKANKNVLEVDEKQAREWLKGFDINYSGDFKDYVIIKHKDDFLGSGKATKNSILNFVPKTRRLKVSD